MKNIVEINIYQKNDFNKDKLFHDFIIRHKNKIFNNEEELKLFSKNHIYIYNYINSQKFVI